MWRNLCETTGETLNSAAFECFNRSVDASPIKMECVHLWEDSQLSRKQLRFIQKLELTSKKFREESEGENSDDLDTVLLFEKWFQCRRTSLKNNEHNKYQKLIDYSNECKALLHVIDETLGKLDSLGEQFEYSSNKTTTLHNTCENILQQQHALIVAMGAIEEKLAFFKELEPMSKKLSSSSSLILNEALSSTLKRLDKCLAFLESKPNYLESSVYFRNFKHLQCQALMTIKNHVTSTIQRSAKQVIPGSVDTLSPNDSVFTLFYGRFQSSASRIKSLMIMIEERCSTDETFKVYVRECHDTYFKARETLISPVLVVAINDMVASHQRSYCTLIRNSTKMLMHICRDEYHLFFQFFTEPTELLNDFLERLCINLYDVLRSVVIHIEHMEILSELCVIFRNEVIDNESLELQSFTRVLSQLLEDTQERLLYRTNVYLHSNIIGYKPAPGDLAYPEKLEMMESIAECLASNISLSRSGSLSSLASTSVSDVSLAANDTSDAHWKSSPADVHGMWYPTVRRTIMCLTKLYRALDREAFQGLAEEVISGCLESLEVATTHITRNKNATDGYLFYIKHLLVIREQISPFKIECTFREVSLDFTRVKSAAMNIFQNRENIFSLTNNNSLLKFLFEVPGAPQVVDQTVDPQRIVDKRIKRACEEYISTSSKILLDPLLQFMSLIESTNKTKNIRTEPFATPSAVASLMKDICECLDKNIAICRKTMALYLSNTDTETILFKPIKSNTLSKLDAFLKFIELNYKREEYETEDYEKLLELKQTVAII